MSNLGLPTGSPRWLREIEMLRTGAAHFLMSGATGSVQLVPRSLIDPESSDGFGFLGFEDCLRAGLLAIGMDHVLRHDVVEGVRIAGSRDGASTIGTILGAQPRALAQPNDLTGVAQLVEAVHRAEAPVALILAGASRLIREVQELSDEEFQSFRRIHIAAGQAAPRAQSLHYNPVVWILDAKEDVPSWFSVGNPLVRTATVPMPDAGERYAAARRRVAQTWPEHHAAEAGAQALAAGTTEMTLSELDAIVRLAEDSGIGPAGLDDAIRAYRIGVTDNPWKRTYVRSRIEAELAGEGQLAQRVKGQHAAIDKTLDILARSVSGLTAAQARTSGTKPRGVLFFAGPTGVGKTELAKAIAEMLFDDENSYIRFDMSEFSADHSADRLIGSPPGYVGHRVGGELTNRVRERPFSVLLFDEIEKAHPRILDKFLQILDEGRLTDGRGETVYFSESIIVFTSNLGIFSDEQTTAADSGRTIIQRVLNVEPATMSADEVRTRIRHAIVDYFQRQLGRPELLNRLGDNIVVFDFITPEVGLQILELMVRNVGRRVQHEYGTDLRLLPGAKQQLASLCTESRVLELGGRGIGNRLETLLVNPLARELALRPVDSNAPIVVAGLEETEAGQPTVRMAAEEQ